MLSIFFFIVAMFIAMVLIPPLMKAGVRYSLVDHPDPRKVHKAPIPRVGGIAMVAGAVTPILIWMGRPREVLAFLAGVGVILLFGVWDDRRSLNYKLKFLGQAIAVAFVVFYGDVIIRFVPFCGTDPVPYAVSLPLTFFALLGITNAINLADGLDGLAGGTTFISMAGICLLAFFASDQTVLMLSSAVMGAIVGFLRFNTYPARVFMGDAGSQFLGFSAGTLVIMLTQSGSTVLSPAMPLLLLGLPILDTFVVMGQRLYEGRSPFAPDRNHIHHKLLSLGYDHYEAVVLVYVVQSILVTAAIYFRFYSDGWNLGLFAGFSAATLLMFAGLKRIGWKAHGQSAEYTPSPLTRLIVKLKNEGYLSRYPAIYLAGFISLYLLYAISRIRNLPYDTGMIIVLMFGVSVVTALILRGSRDLTLIERLIICTTLTAAVFYHVTQINGDLPLLRVENGGFAVLVLALIVCYRFSSSREFRATPMDYLVLFAVLVIPNLMAKELVSGGVGEVAAKSALLYYGVELLISHYPDRTWLVRVISCAVLATFTARVAWF